MLGTFLLVTKYPAEATGRRKVLTGLPVEKVESPQWASMVTGGHVNKLVTSALKSGSGEMDAHTPLTFSFLFNQSSSPKNGATTFRVMGSASLERPSQPHPPAFVWKVCINPNKLTIEINHYTRWACPAFHSDYSHCSFPPLYVRKPKLLG